MPTYDYTCRKCGHRFERVQSMKDAALTTCPQDVCPGKRWGKGKVARGIGGGAGLIFKGSGFYLTDYRSESYKAGAKKESEAAAPKAEAKPEAKPAAKTEAAKPAAK
jgi:putative FmdB family regulatory protein